MAVTIRLETGILDGLIADTRDQPHTKIVADGVHYGIYQEMGTYKMAAHPFMRPAVEAVRGGFERAFQDQLTTEQIDAVVEKTARDVEHLAKRNAPVDTGALRNSIHVE